MRRDQRRMEPGRRRLPLPAGDCHPLTTDVLGLFCYLCPRDVPLRATGDRGTAAEDRPTAARVPRISAQVRFGPPWFGHKRLI